MPHFLGRLGAVFCLGAFACTVFAQAVEPPTQSDTLRFIDLPLPPAAVTALETGIKASPELIHEQLKASKAALVAALGLKVVQDYEYLPLLLVEISTDVEQMAIEQASGVERMWEIPVLEPQISATASANQMQANLAEAAGFDGSGTSVLVTDTAPTSGPPVFIHPDFGDCDQVGQTPDCQLWTWQTFLPTGSDTHGLFVASIVARTARGAGIHFADIGYTNPSNPNKDLLSALHAYAALSWAVQNQQTYNIVAHNMSWGSAPVNGDCSDGLSAFQAARSVGIAQFAATGNDSTNDSVAGWNWPACSPVVMSVGAVDTTQTPWKVASFSNSDSDMSFLAPGYDISAGGYFGSGTSMASPHVAGAYAVLQSSGAWEKTIGDFDLGAAMRERGIWVNDTRGGGQGSFPVPQMFATRPIRLDVINRFDANYSLLTPRGFGCGVGCYHFLPDEVASLQLGDPGIIALNCQLSGMTCTTVMDRQRAITLMPRTSLVAAMSVINARVATSPKMYFLWDLPGGIEHSEVRDAVRVGPELYAVGGASTVAGSTGPDTAWLWSLSGGGLVPLPNAVENTTATTPLFASAITPDAKYVAGRTRTEAMGNSRQAARYTVADPLSSTSPSVLTEPAGFAGNSAANAISADGSILYGFGDNLNQAARYLADGSPGLAIPFLGPNDDSSVPAGRGSSADGSVMVGTSTDLDVAGVFFGPGSRAFRYVHGAGVSAVPLLPGGGWSFAIGLTPDGEHVLAAGNSTSAPLGELYQFHVQSGTLTPWGTPNPSWSPSNAGGVTADGGIMVVSFGSEQTNQDIAWLRTASGWHNLKQVAEAGGIDLSGWTIDFVNGISPDGRLVWGSGLYLGGRHGWVMEFPEGYLAALPAPPVEIIFDNGFESP